MARTPDLIEVPVHDLMLLLSYKWAVINNLSLGEVGPETYQNMTGAIDGQSNVRLKPAQLADLVYHLREGVLGRVKPARLEFTEENHNRIMRHLKQCNPTMFKELPSGEVVMVELEERAYE